MKKKLLLGLLCFLLASSIRATIRTVCPSGCDYTTISSAIAAASNGDTVFVNVTGAFTESNITVNKNLVIRGQGQTTTFVQANATRNVSGNYRIFIVTATGSVTFSDMTIRHARQNNTTDPQAFNGAGPAMFINTTAGTYNLVNVSIKDNDNPSDAGGAGGGICFNGSGNTLNMTNCRVEGNIDGGNSAGGIYLSGSGTFVAKNTVFDNNSAGSAGAVSLSAGIIPSFYNCTFSNNVATNGSGGAVSGNSAIPSFYNCTFNNNTGTAGGALRIGGCYIYNCTFVGNTATSATGGGAVSRGGTSNPTYIVNCTFSGNTSPAGSGTDIHWTNTTGFLHIVNNVMVNPITGVDFFMTNTSQLGTNQKNIAGSSSFGSGSASFFATSTTGLSAALANNGGLTQTLAITSGASNLVNNGHTGAVTGITYPTKDQRNFLYVGTPDIGAYEYNGTQTLSITYAPLINTTSTSNRVLSSVTIIDNTGVPTSGTLAPRVYYRRNSGSWVSVPGTLSSGTATNGSWSFTIDYSLIGGVAAGDQINYFVVAQDVNSGAIPQSGPTGVVAGDVNSIGTYPTPNTYNISPLDNNSIAVHAQRGSKYVTVGWSLEQEEQVQSYEVERSNDGRSFISLTNIPSSEKGSYSYIDIDAAQASQYYRIKANGKNNKSEYSSIVKLAGIDATGNIAVKNPLDGNSIMFMFTDMPDGDYKASLYSMYGQLVYSGNIAHPGGSATNTLAINNGVLSRGQTYLLTVSSPGWAFTYKLVVE